MIPPLPWSLVYADGAANEYRFEASGDEVRFSYSPVTPERSSTGRYSGGEPRDERLPHDDPRLRLLWRQVSALENDRAHHAEHRAKGDGAFTMTLEGETRSFLVRRPALTAFEAWLQPSFREEGTGKSKG